MALALLPWTLQAQTAREIGLSLQASCGVALDPTTQAVLAGTVADSLSGVVLKGATVRASWRITGDSVPTVLETQTDEEGIYGFCALPAGADVTLSATILGAESAPLLVETEAGTLEVVPLSLPLSDESSRGTLVGRIIDPAARRPVADAVVHLLELGQSTMTNASGYFAFSGQPWGVYTLEVTRLGYAPLTAGVRVAGNLTQRLEFLLSPDALELEGITVHGRPTGRDIDGMVRRMNLGLGEFIGREAIEQRPGTRVAELLEGVPGVIVRRGLYGAINLEVRGRACVPDVFVDGVHWGRDAEAGLDFHVGEIEALEVYKGVQTPAEFLVGRGFPCAVVVVWTRRGG